MKKDIHPEYQTIVIKDTSCDFAFLTRSTAKPRHSIKWEDGNEYPLLKMEITSASHPFFTGTQRLLDSEGRVEKFKKKFGARRSLKSLKKDK